MNEKSDKPAKQPSKTSGGSGQMAAYLQTATDWLLARLADRHKWPRRWWWPILDELSASDDDWKREHDEVSMTIRYGYLSPHYRYDRLTGQMQTMTPGGKWVQEKLTDKKI